MYSLSVYFWGCVITKKKACIIIFIVVISLLSVPCFAAEDSLSTVQNFVFNRDSGIVPTASFSGVSGMDDRTYGLTANIKGWQSDSLYQWSNFSSSSSYFAFKTFNSSIYIPVNIPVPLSESNVVYIPDFYFVYTGMGDNPVLSSFQLNFVDSSNSYQESINLKSVTSIDSNNRIITCEGTSVELGTGNWVLKSIRFGLSIGNTVVVSSPSFSFGLSGFSFTLTSSITFSDYLTKQTQDILTNEVVPAVETLNNTMNNVNSSVQDVNTSVQAVEDAVSQGNQTLTEISETLDKMPESVLNALESQAVEEVEQFESSVEDGKQEILDVLDGTFQLSSISDNFKKLFTAFAYDGYTTSLTFPGASLPAQFGGQTLWEEQQIEFDSFFSQFPSVFLILVRSVFTLSILFGCLKYVIGIVHKAMNANMP